MNILQEIATVKAAIESAKEAVSKGTTPEEKQAIVTALKGVTSLLHLDHQPLFNLGLLAIEKAIGLLVKSES